MMHSHDIRQAWRALWKYPGFTIVAALTLAIGIGANTAIFSFVNAILLKPLPYKEPDRLVELFENHLTNGWHKVTLGAPMIDEWRRQNTVFEGIAGRGWSGFILTGRGQPEQLKGRLISANAFSLLGIKPFLGRDFLPTEETNGNHHVILLSHESWKRRFGSEKDIIGRSLTINGDVCTVVGVMPPNTRYPDPNLDLWMPLAFNADQLSNRHAHNYQAFARLKPGITLERARAEMDSIVLRMADANAENRGWGAEVFPMHEIIVGDSQTLLWMLLGSVGLVLLIGCANIANLLLARAAARAHEFGIRLALGASPVQIVRQLLTESLALSALGGILGILVAFAGLKMLLHFSPPDLPRISEGVHLDGPTLLFTAAASIIAGLFFGLAPALQVTNPSLVIQINETSRGNSSGLRRHRLRAAFVISEVALSLMLLAGAGLFIRSFARIVSQDLGFNPEHLITAGVGLPDRSYSDQADKARFFDRLLTNLRELPGLENTALAYGVPLTGQSSSLYARILGEPEPRPGESVAAGYSQISEGYFRAMNTPILAGRDFNNRDLTNAQPTVIVDEKFVRNFHLGTNVVGRHIKIGDGTEDAEIIGLVRETKRTGVAEETRGEMYRPFRQNLWGYMNVVVRRQQDPSAFTRLLRAEIDKIDKDIPIDSVRTMTQLVNTSVAQRRLSVQLLTGFASVALFLAAIGIYGVLACSVTERRQEIGIRMALGAQRSDVLNLVVGQGMRMVLIGVALGIAGALGVGRLIATLLYQVKPFDPMTFGAVSILLTVAALLACYLPAKRATRVEPIVALRHE
jgi:putative ABC transport system permease protein